MATNPTVQEKKPRDTTNRLDVRMHKNTSFLAFAYRGNLYTFFPRGTFKSQWDPLVSDRKATLWVRESITDVKWIEKTKVTPILFGLLAYSKTPYKPSKGE
jgi:hypothetical protein